MDEKHLTKEAGVTLIEMLVVVTIIALFAALVAPAMLKQGDKARSTMGHAQVNSFMTALGSYKLDTSMFPTTEQGLQALRAKPGDLANWNGPYLPKEIPADPWGRPYIYKYPGDHGDEPDIVSYGADGAPGGEGVNADIVSWSSK
jgi:general secretion pathway protein G